MIIIGHRGATSVAFENTLSSFQKALQIGVDMIELDIYVTRDYHLVVCHDNYLQRLLDISKFVHELTLAELQSYRLPNDETIPTLSQVIKLVNKKIPINIEVKTQSHNVVPILSHTLNNFLTQGWKSVHFLVSSYDLSFLSKLYNSNPSILLGVIQGNIDQNPLTYLEIAQNIKAVAIMLDKELIYHPEMSRVLNLYQENNIHTYVFTVNDPYFVKKHPCFKLISGIMTDYPEKFLKKNIKIIIPPF